MYLYSNILYKCFNINILVFLYKYIYINIYLNSSFGNGRKVELDEYRHLFCMLATFQVM